MPSSDDDFVGDLCGWSAYPPKLSVNAAFPFGSPVPEAEVNAFQGHQAWFCFDHSRHLGYVPSRVRI
jgi:hypothetical protein